MESNNIFTEAFEQYHASQAAARIQSKFEPRPYFVRFKPLRWVVLTASYFFNLFSGLTASSLVYFFGVQLMGHWLPAAAVTLLFLVLLEVSKRMTAAANWKDYLQYKRASLGLVSASLGLMIISTSFSYFGAKRAVAEFTPPPVMVNVDSLTTPLLERMDIIDLEVAAARETKYKGTTTRTSQRTIELLSNERASLQNQIFAIEASTKTDNKEMTQNHTATTAINAEYFALITLLSELLFLLCAWYLEYFDFRTYIEMNYRPITDLKTLSNNEGNDLKNNSLPPVKPAIETPVNDHKNNASDNEQPPEQPPIDEQERKELFEKARRNYNAYKSKFNNGKGIAKTNLAGMQRWREEMEQLSINEELPPPNDKVG